MGTDKRDLVMLATEIADSLIATALRRRLADASAAAAELGTTLALPARPQLALPPAPVPPRRGRKPGPKPKRRVKPGPQPRAKAPEPTTRQTDRPRKAAVTSAAAGPGADLAGRKCRSCKKAGTAERVAGTERTVRCTSCKTTWKIRLKASEAGAGRASARPTSRRQASAANECRRCDHTEDQHIGEDGKCLVPKCGCGEFYE